jgi:uncharacterized protein (DUF3820 family)
MRICLWCLLSVLSLTPLFADDQIRDVQEELRKRNLYFGEVDGRMTPDLANSLKRYQARKGFPASGEVDQLTANSLNVQTVTVAATKQTWPDVPVLKSDAALEIAEEQRQLLVRQAEENPDAITNPAPPAEEPPPSQNVTPDRINSLVQEYLRDAETGDVASQTRYFAYPVDYFRHGAKGEAFVAKDVANYCKRWPDRKYALLEPVTFTAGQNEGETIVEFPITFSVRNKSQAANGKTRNTWRVRGDGEDFKIVAIHEERLRD